MSDYVDSADYYDYDIYDEDLYNDDGYDDEDIDLFNVNEYGEHSSDLIRRHNSGWSRRRAVAEAILNIHYDLYMGKEPCRTSAFTGAKWIAELNVGHPKRMYQAFRMCKTNFLALCQLLEGIYGLREAKRISVQEQVAIFLWIVGQRANNRSAQERFQRSRETISRRFHHGAIAAIDGTHIKALPNPNDIAKWIGRKGYPTQNIMAACDFDMCFTFVLSGWEGSAHDTRIFYDCIRDTTNNFPHPQHGEYYLVDAGYPNIRGFLAPYKGCTYHVLDWGRGRQPRNNFECFNKIHSSLRGTIEGTFRVRKARWPLIYDMPVGYSMETQKGLVTATMAVHNFIRRSNMPNIAFRFYNTRPEFMSYERGVETTTPNGVHGEMCQHDDGEMDHVRTQIRDHIVANRIR
ncbi:hypothetical protein Vadar_023664 [Vaccinium darrowii]|uniref:Uncharacterized protein n=1 Tax=Vaccinium darrowii TaxID=229202 RepID=A0ACB7ZLY8_9ERIC|nr:hypothetical protein Vadar_023664 [Vaccinium darrowii]